MLVAINGDIEQTIPNNSDSSFKVYVIQTMNTVRCRFEGGRKDVSTRTP